MDEICVLHVFCETLQETQGLVKDDGHGDFRQFLSENIYISKVTHAISDKIRCN